MIMMIMWDWCYFASFFRLFILLKCENAFNGDTTQTAATKDTRERAKKSNYQFAHLARYFVI